ncbi:MAG TPA: hypothetical protein V6C97_27425, partial [Oculatellaceae cyanobacterium]
LQTHSHTHTQKAHPHPFSHQPHSHTHTHAHARTSTSIHYPNAHTYTLKKRQKHTVAWKSTSQDHPMNEEHERRNTGNNTRIRKAMEDLTQQRSMWESVKDNGLMWMCVRVRVCACVSVVGD